MDTIVCTDFLSELQKLESESVHLIISDISHQIAYEENGEKKRGKPLNGRSEADRKTPLDFYNQCMRWTVLLQRILKPGASVFILGSGRFVHRCATSLEDAGLILRDTLSWETKITQNRAQRADGVFDRRFDALNSLKWRGWKLGNLQTAYEPILWFFKPYKIGGTITDNLLLHELGAYNENAFLNYTNHPSNVIRVHTTAGERMLHSTEKPLGLFKALIELTTLEGHTVLDPFCGNGAALAAAKELNRHYYGIESDRSLCNSAQARLDKIEAQTTLL